MIDLEKKSLLFLCTFSNPTGPDQSCNMIVIHIKLFLNCFLLPAKYFKTISGRTLGILKMKVNIGFYLNFLGDIVFVVATCVKV